VRSACAAETHFVLNTILYPIIETPITRSPMVNVKKLVAVMSPPIGAHAQMRRHTKSKSETANTKMGASGHHLDVQAKGAENSVRPCALIAALKRKDVRPITAQLVKKEALVIETSQLRTSYPVPRRHVSVDSSSGTRP
jgi:hypothetical protein